MFCGPLESPEAHPGTKFRASALPRLDLQGVWTFFGEEGRGGDERVLYCFIL